MDNQFRRRYRGHSDLEETPNRQKKQDDIIDLYDDVKPKVEGEPDPEVEELKRLAQSDALKAYAWLRRKTAGISAQLRAIRAKITPKHVRLAKIAGIAAVAAILSFKFVPGVVDRFKGNENTLGETQTAADFDTLNPDGDAPDTTYDSEVGVSIYKDVIGGVEATVSQQVIPENLKDNPSEMQKLALSLSDKVSSNRYETEKGIIYIATTTKNTNIVIFGYNDLLVFIRSTALVDDQTWIDYVNGLK